jgi:hypothetical protein
MKRIYFAVAVLVTWYLTINLPIWCLEIPGIKSGYSLLDPMSNLVNDNYHLPFMFFSGPAIAIAALINPSKLLFATFGLYIIILICGFLGFAFSSAVALKWGWYVHLAAMSAVVLGAGGKFLPEAFEQSK